jgi:alanine dehydrogenase
MRVGVPTEIREEEYRVALTPAGTRELTDRGHEVLVQRGAGLGSLFPDEAYIAAGARIVHDAQAVFEGSDLIVKVKSPCRRSTGAWNRDTCSSPSFTWLRTARSPTP